MSRRLVSGAQRSKNDTPARSRDEASRPGTALPPYEPPKYAMSEKYQRQLNSLMTTSHDYDKYKTHVKAAIQSITNCTAEGYDQVHNAKEDATRLAKKRERAQEESGEEIPKTDTEEQAEQRAFELQQKVDKLAKEAEKSLRELIDYGDELAQQSNIIKAVQEDVAINAMNAPAINPINTQKKRRRREAVAPDEESMEDDEDMEVDEPEEAPFDVLSATELLQMSKTNYAADYSNQSLRKRYGC